MRAIVSLSWHTWPHSHKEWGSSWHGRDEERRNREGHSGLPRAAWTVQPPQEHPGMWKHQHPCFKGWVEYSSRFTASQQRRVKVQINARGEWSQEPTRYNCDFLHRTGEASPELDPPMSPQLASVKIERKSFKNQVLGQILSLILHLNVAFEHILNLTVIRTQWASSSWPLAPTRALRRFRSFTLTMLMSLSKQNAWIRVKWIWRAMSHSKSSVAKRQKDTLSGSLWTQKCGWNELIRTV